jgi:hypothetical protein
MNGRTALGAALVVLAVLAGALFLDRSQRLVPVYAAARDLPAGTSLHAGDLVIIRVRLPASALRHYLRPSAGRPVTGGILTAPVRRETLVPAGFLLTSSRDADLVELPVQVDPGDMARGLRPGDSVQVLAAYTEGARRGRAVVLLPAAEVVQVLQDPAGFTASGQERGVQLRMPSDRAPIVAAAIATARIFVVKAPGPVTEEPSSASPPGGTRQPPTDPSEPDLSEPGTSTPDLAEPDASEPDASQPGGSLPGGQPVPTSAYTPDETRPTARPDASQPDTSTRGRGRAPTSPYPSGGTRPTVTRPPSRSGR